jgi:hypothetical protein
MSSDEWHRNIQQWREGQAAMTTGNRTTIDYTNGKPDAPLTQTFDLTISTTMHAKAVAVRWLTGDSWRVSAEIAVEMECGGKYLDPVTQQISATVPRAEVGAAVQKILDTLNG